MDDWLRRNRITFSLGLGAVLFIAWMVTREPLAMTGALIFFVVALLGDRLKKAPLGFEFFRDRVVRQVQTEARSPAADPESRRADGVEVSSDPVAASAPTEELKPGTPPPTVTIGRLTSDAAVQAMVKAATPEELAERVVDYVELRTVSGLPESTQPTIFMDHSDQSTGLISLTERAAGFFTDGLGSANVFGLSLTTGELFVRAPWAVVTAGDLKLLNDLVGGTSVIGTLYADAMGNSCARWTVHSASTVASTIEIRGTDASGVVLPSGALNGPRLSIPASLAPGSAQMAILVGSSADVAIGINTTDPVEGGPALVTLVSTAIRAFESSVVVSGASRPIIAAGSVDALAGNIIISETLHGQFKPGQEICVTILPRASDGVLTQDTFVKTATTNDLPITTTNAATGLLVSTVSASGLPPKLESSSVLLPTLSTGFRFKVAQRSSGSSLGQITISNIHLITVVGALKGPVLIDVMGDAQGGAIAFQTIVSNALIG